MKFHIENIRYDGHLALHGWLFDPDRAITRFELCSSTPYGRDVRSANWGFVRNDVYEGHRCEASLRSGFRVDGLLVDPQAQIDLCLTFGNGETLEIPLALFSAGGTRAQPQPCLHVLSACSTSRLNVVAAGDACHDLANLIDCLHTGDPVPKKRPGHQPQELVNVLVSVYKGLEYLEPFFASVFADPGYPFELTVVDNGNTDADVLALLEETWNRYKPTMRLVRVEKNEGYIRGICAAYEAAPPGRHAVVLNTDLVLPPRWLERLIEPLLNHDDIATVTPFTNAGTVCSFPIVGEDNRLFRDLPVEVIDRAFQTVAWPRDGVTLPSGVGFCMALNKDVIARIGWFDWETYGFGYGEENDWSLQAHRLGYRNILMPSMYVWHKHGGVYLAEEKRRLIARNLETINTRFPEYRGMVRDYFSTDPLFGLRALIAARILTQQPGTPAHAAIAGASHASAAAALSRKAAVCAQGGVYVWIDSGSGPGVQVSVFTQEIAAIFRTSSPATLAGLLRILNVTDLMVYDPAANTTITTALDLLTVQDGNRIAIHLVLADYTLFCPTRNLIDHRGEFCGLPETEACDSCLRMQEDTSGLSSTVTSIAEWRNRFSGYLDVARSIVFTQGCSRALAEDGLRRYFRRDPKRAGRVDDRLATAPAGKQNALVPGPGQA